jgi:hypothetical protein
MTCEIINVIDNIADYTYLELGVAHNENFRNIQCINKMSVDMNGNGIYTGTTDDYFSSIKGTGKLFDIIFIDANHDYEYALRDFNNAVHHAARWIIMHDMIPPSKMHTESRFCSDSYKILHHVCTKEKFEVFPMGDEYGTTFFKVPLSEINPDSVSQNLTYEEFVEFLKTIKIYSTDEIAHILKDANV